MAKKNFQDTNNSYYSCSSELSLGESALPKYNKYIVGLLKKGVPNNSRILDFGAGIGTLANIFRGLHGISPDCFEVDENHCKFLLSRGFKVIKSRDQINFEYDAIYTSNVLEHIEDDVDALRWINKILKHGGTLSIYVPAHNCIYSKFDEIAGHYRRYNYKLLGERLQLAGFRIVEYKYVDSIGFFMWYLLKNKDLSSDSGVSSSASFKFYDSYIFPLSKLLDKVFSRFIGKNIYIRAIKD
jgi:SAM-dependent methyltransferase